MGNIIVINLEKNKRGLENYKIVYFFVYCDFFKYKKYNIFEK